MPLSTWIVEPIHLNSKHPSLQACPDTATKIASLRKNDHNTLYKDFNDVASSTCVGMIKQLMNITIKVGIMFEELQDESMKILKRSEQLQTRVVALKDKTDNFNPVVDIISLDDTLQSTPYKSGQNSSTATERPKLVQEVFCRIENMPEFQLLDPFKGPEEKTRCQMYSDPNFFFESWCLQVQQEVVKKPLKKKTRAKKEKNKVRQPKQTKKDQLKSKVNSDFLSKGVKTKSRDGDNKENDGNKVDIDVISQSSKSLIKSIDSETPSIISDTTLLMNPPCEFDDTLPPPPPPPFNQDWLQPAIPSDPLPPPPILHCPQSPSNRGSLYKVSNFDASNFPPSPPTPPCLQAASTPNHTNSHVPPPPPPPTESFVQTPQKCSDTPVVKKVPLTKQDSRSDLLSAIRKGMKLRKVDEEEKIKSRANEDVACALFNVEKIMEMRRRALEEADEEEEEEEDEEDWNDD